MLRFEEVRPPPTAMKLRLEGITAWKGRKALSEKNETVAFFLGAPRKRQRYAPYRMSEEPLLKFSCGSALASRVGS